MNRIPLEYKDKGIYNDKQIYKVWHFAQTSRRACYYEEK